MVGCNVLFGIYLVLALCGCIAGGIFTAFETEGETNILVCAFYLQSIIYEDLKGDANEGNNCYGLVSGNCGIVCGRFFDAQRFSKKVPALFGMYRHCRDALLPLNREDLTCLKMTN